MVKKTQFFPKFSEKIGFLNVLIKDFWAQKSPKDGGGQPNFLDFGPNTF